MELILAGGIIFNKVGAHYVAAGITHIPGNGGIRSADDFFADAAATGIIGVVNEQAAGFGNGADLAIYIPLNAIDAFGMVFYRD